MRAYLISIGAGRQFMTVERDARQKAREEGGTCEQVEVPTDKAGLIDFLNRFSVEVKGAALARADGAQAPARAGECPKCHLTPAGAAKAAEGMTAEAIAERIRTGDGLMLSRLAGAVVDRVAELARAAAGGGR